MTSPRMKTAALLLSIATRFITFRRVLAGA
jgi:hypothetical protein